MTRLLFIGDIVGKQGRELVRRGLAAIVRHHEIDFVIANGENAAAGFGITPDLADDLLGYGIQVLTGGNHERFAGRDGVTLRGFVDDDGLIALYRDALAVILPSFMEGFGLPALEAMALGTPAITSTAAALVEVTGDDALHADPHSAKTIAPRGAALPAAFTTASATSPSAYAIEC